MAMYTWNDVVLREYSIRTVGAFLIIFGNVLAVWGVKTLGVKASSGQKHRLVIKGPYKYTRNPQYLGDIIALTGLAILVSSIYVLIASSLAITTFLLMPLSEEKWLVEQYGEEYIRYMRNTPGFINLYVFKRLFIKKYNS